LTTLRIFCAIYFETLINNSCRAFRNQIAQIWVYIAPKHHYGTVSSRPRAEYRSGGPVTVLLTTNTIHQNKLEHMTIHVR
jgi:hypothetical protein